MSTLTVFCTFLYIVPILSLIARLLNALVTIFRYLLSKIIKAKTSSEIKTSPLKNIFNKINFYLGLFEYYISPPRNPIMGIFFFCLIVIRFISSLKEGIATDALTGVTFPLFFLALTFYGSHHALIVSLKMAEFLRDNPGLHPKSFFDTFHNLFGPFSYTMPDSAKEPTVSPENISFKEHTRSKQSIFPFIPIFWDTGHLAYTAFRSVKYVGKRYGVEVFDNMASMWGKRVLDHFHASFEVIGRKKLENLNGKNIIIMNHKGQLDFVLGFFALSDIKLAGGRGIRNRFITAKDHFVDNLLVYEMIGIGKLLEATDTVFIDRKKRGEAFLNLKQAAKDLAEKDIDIVIFPQGTRAEGNVDRSQKRRDAGYYTTVPPKDISSDLGHLRKGTAHLAVDTLMELAKTDNTPLNLIFIGLTGTATALSKKSFKIQTEADIQYKIGEILTLSPDMVEGSEEKYLDLVDAIHRKIDENLASCLDIHKNLHHRFLLDLQGHFRFTAEKIQSIETNLDHLARESPIPYHILDRIYACPLREWNPYLSELAHLLMEQCPVERFRTLRTQVTTRMLESKGKKLHRKRIEKASDF